MDLREQGDRLLGTAAQAVRSVGDHARHLALGLILVAGAARAEQTAWTGNAFLRLDIDRAIDESRSPSHGRVAAGAEGFSLVHWFAASVRAQFGAGWNGGFLADATLSLGGGVHLGHEGYLVAMIGAGIDGVVGTLPYTFHAPVEIAGEIDLGMHVRLHAWDRMSWVTASARRHGSTVLDPVFDEWNAGLGVRFGNRVDYDAITTGSGYLVGVEIRQAERATYVGGVLAFQLGGGGRN